MEKIHNYIDGVLQEPIKGLYIDNFEPATGKVYGTIPNSTVEDVDLAVKSAQLAYDQWSSTPVAERSKILYRIAALIEDQAESLALAESKDNGKPLSTAKTIDIPRAAENFRFFAEAIGQFSSESHPMGQTAINYTLRNPIGVVACISPWNLPLYLFTWKIAPALSTGNCVIAKPSEVTPMTAFLLSEICIQAGLPKGVLNILHGEGGQIGPAICEHPGIKAISFTGGTATGAKIAEMAAPKFKKLSLELGGKNPAIVFADCDKEKTLNGLMRAMFTNQGQICLCGSRVYIERSIYEEFKSELVKRVEQLTVGDPSENDGPVNMGAVVSKPHQEKVLSYIELAKQEGGTILTGGSKIDLPGRCEQGYFVAPTLIEGLTIDCRTNQEEIFGPVVTLEPFDSEDQALTLANGTGYGLAATLWTENLTRAHAFAQQLEFGIVWINCWLLRDLRTPFGGVKQSGVGREGGHEALRFFTEPKNVCIQFGN